MFGAEVRKDRRSRPFNRLDVIGVRLGEVVRGRQYRAAEDNQPKKRSTDRFRPSSVDGTQHTRYTIDRRDRKLHRRLVFRLRS